MIKRGLIMATCVGALMATSSAKAETAYDAEGSLTPFIYYWTYRMPVRNTQSRRRT